MTKDDKRLADYWLRRWAWLSRRGLPDVGYKHQSPEQSMVGDYSVTSYEEMPEDAQVNKLIGTMNLTLKNITRLYYSQAIKPKQIAERENLTARQVRSRLDMIRYKVIMEVKI